MNVSSIWAVAAAEMRLDRRLARTWVFIVVMILFTAVIVLNTLSSYSMASAVSSSTLINSPLMLPYQMNPNLVFFIWLGVIFLAFDIYARDKRERLEEVVGTLPVSNFEIVLGRATGITVLMSLPIVIAVVLYYIVGLGLRLGSPESGMSESEPYLTLAMLLIDTVPNILMCVALVMGITSIVRYRAIALIIALGSIGLLTWGQNQLPIYILNIINSFSSGTYLPSFVAPTFTTPEILTHRFGMLTMSFAFLCLTAALYPRLDKTNKPRLLMASGLLVVIASITMVMVSAQFRAEYVAQQHYASVHQPYADQNQFDIESMSGTVSIDPGDDINIQLELLVKAVQPIDESDPMIFSLNPGYDIRQLSWNGAPVDFEFSDGLLLVPAPQVLSASQSGELAIQAEGELDMRFAYLDSAVSVLGSDVFEAFGLIFQGSLAGINDSAYVAYVPALAWYPMPGAHVHRDLKDIRPRDFFDLDVAVAVPSDWHVAGPGKGEISEQANSSTASFLPVSPVHEVALFAAEFERRTMEVGGIEFELLVTPRSITNVDLFEPVADDLRIEIEDLLARARDTGLDYPYRTFTLVETPINLRAYGGGWRMDTAQSFPGIFTIREGGFFNASFQAPFERLDDNTELSDEERREKKLAYLTRYFKNDVTGGNAYIAATDNLFQYQTDATGLGAIPLSYLMSYLSRNLATDLELFYSAHVSMSASSAGMSTIGSMQVANNPDGETLSQKYFSWYIDQPNVWEFMQERPISEAHYADVQFAKQNLHALHLWGQSMAKLMRNWLGDDQLGEFLALVRDRFDGQSYTYADLQSTALELGIDLNQVLGDWLTQEEMPGFRVSQVTTERLPDLEYSVPRYESSFFIENAEPIAGLVNVFYHSGEEMESEFDLNNTAPIKLPGNSAVEVALVGENPIQYIQIEPYLSYNRQGFTLNVQRRRQYEMVERDPKPMVQPATWQYEIGDAIIVDDLDQGFLVDVQPPVGGIQAVMFSLMATAFGDPVRDQGLPAMDPERGGLQFSFNEWSRQPLDVAYGKYRRTLARAFQHATTANAHFTANLPTAGNWKLEYHLPDVNSMAGEFGGAVFGPAVGAQINVRNRRRRDWGDFDMWLTNGDRETPIEMDGERAEQGWNVIGEYDLADPKVTLSVSTRTSDGIVVADAIRWTPAS